MAAPRPDQGAFAEALTALLPRGTAWPREPGAVLTRSLRGLAGTPAALHADAADLLDREADPRLTATLLADWERAYGLPDGCVTYQDGSAWRRETLVGRLTAQGGQSRAYFIAVAAGLGHAITITEFRIATYRGNYAGAYLGAAWAHAWRVNAASVTIRPAIYGQAAYDQAYRSWGNAPLECALNRLKPAHTVLLFAYSGPPAEARFFRSGWGTAGQPLRG